MESYLRWLSSSTKTDWWCDSGDPSDIRLALEHGAVGITTNPALSAAAASGKLPEFAEKMKGAAAMSADPTEKAQLLVEIIAKYGAAALNSLFEESGKKRGYLCAQIDPSQAGNRNAMREMGRRFSSWAPNISVKLPATMAGIAVLEELAAKGIPTTGTVSFTLPQMLAVAEAYERGAAKARASGKTPAPCNAVLMIGRIDDYLAEVAADNGAAPSSDDIKRAGIAIAKRAYELFKQKRYGAKILVAALRGTYHATELAGGELILSIHPKYQKPLMLGDTPKLKKIDDPIDTGALERLYTMKEFVRAYEPAGLAPEEFIRFGATQRTLSQFLETGWKVLEAYK